MYLLSVNQTLLFSYSQFRIVLRLHLLYIHSIIYIVSIPVFPSRKNRFGHSGWRTSLKGVLPSPHSPDPYNFLNKPLQSLEIVIHGTIKSKIYSVWGFYIRREKQKLMRYEYHIYRPAHWIILDGINVIIHHHILNLFYQTLPVLSGA